MDIKTSSTSMRLDIGMSKTTGRTIAVLGAGPGLGGAVARRFGTEGYSVALMARRPEQLRQMAEELRAQGITEPTFIGHGNSLLPGDVVPGIWEPDDVAKRG